jgi:hypothetical protein
MTRTQPTERGILPSYGVSAGLLVLGAALLHSAAALTLPQLAGSPALLPTYLVGLVHGLPITPLARWATSDGLALIGVGLATLAGNLLRFRS